MEKKLDGNYTRMLRAILNKFWRQHPTKQQLYGHSPPITKTIKIRRTRHAGHCWRRRDEFIRGVLLWTPSHGQAKAGQPDTGCSLEDVSEAMDDWEGWRERGRDICADGATWWWWNKGVLIQNQVAKQRFTKKLYIYIYIYNFSVNNP